MSPVPLLDLKIQFPQYREEALQAIERIAEAQRFILGPEGEGLERELAEYAGAPHGIGVSSGSDALLLALMALRIGPGDEVITSPYTFFATASAIVRLGGRPRFVDIQPDTLNLDPRAAARAVNKRTRALLPVHLFGHPCDMGELGALARKANIPLIEDAAQAVGAVFNRKRVGSLGRLGCFSFFPSKNLAGWGDGGFLTASNARLADRLRRLRNHGMHPQYHYPEIGINGRLDEIQAAVLRIKLRRLEGWIEGRRQAAHRYGEYFAQAGMTGRLQLPTERLGCRHVYHQYVVRVNRGRDGLWAHLKAEGIGSAVYYPLSLHQQKCFSFLGHRRGEFPESEKAARQTLALPIFPEITPDQQQQVVDAVVRWSRR